VRGAKRTASVERLPSWFALNPPSYADVYVVVPLRIE
jgi:hypothetical protein